MSPVLSRAFVLLTVLLIAVGSAVEGLGQCVNPNGSFSSGLSDWTRESGDVTVAAARGRYAAVEVDEGSVRQYVTVSGGGEYSLSFDVYGADKNSRSKQPYVTVRAFRSVAGVWLPIWSDEVFRENIDRRWTRRSATFTVPPETDFIMYYLGNERETSYFDEVCLSPSRQSLSSNCGTSNPSFDRGLDDWTSKETGVTVRAEGAVNYVRIARAWVATKASAVIGAEEYTLQFRARRVAGTAVATPWVSLKYYASSGGADVLIREEPLAEAPLTEEWADYAVKAVTPPNATTAKLVIGGGGVHVDLDRVCLQPTATLYRECVSDGSSSGTWSGYEDYGRHEGRENTFEIEDGFARHRFSVTPGKVMRFNGEFFGADEDEDPSSFSVIWRDSDGTDLATETLADGAFPESWQPSTLSATAPPGAAEGEFRVGNPEETVYYRQLCVSEIGTPGAASTISGAVFSDLDSDAEFDGEEPHLGGSSLVLYRDDGDGVADPNRDIVVDRRLSTNLTESYTFNGLAPGDYFLLAYLAPTKYISQYRASGVADERQSYFRSYTFKGQTAGISDLIALDGESFTRDVNLGQRPSQRAAVSGFVWSDANRNGLRDESRRTSGINGITLRAYDASTDALLKTTVTQNDPSGNPGHYLFNFVEAKPIYVVIGVPGGATLSEERTPSSDMRFRENDARTEDIPLAPDGVYSNTSAAVYLSATEICDNGIDDDGDGRADEADSDCTTCVRQDEVLCGEPYRHFIPPVWEMADPTETVFNGPAYLIITTDADATAVRGATPDGSWSFDRTATRTTELRVPVPRAVMQTAAQNSARANHGLILESADPVNVVYFIDGSYNKALVTMKGEQALGNRFFAGSQTIQKDCRNSSGLPTVAGPSVARREAHFISVMATEDDTRVTFDWRDDITTYEGITGGTHAVTLDRGESYLIRDAYTNETVSGTRITSDRAITVLSGSQHTNVCDNGGLDAGIDQLVPECYVGNEYVAVKHKGRDNQHYVVVVPTQDNTEIRLDGAVVATRDALDYEQIMIAGSEGDPHLISADAPVYVYHVSGISTNNEVGMALAASFGECRGNRYLTFARDNDRSDVQRSLNIVVSAAVAPSLTLNGTNTLPGSPMIVQPVPGRPDYLSVVVPGDNLLAINTLQADGYFQAALLIGIDGDSGTYGYLTSFAQGIEVRDPDTDVPSSRYSLSSVCGGTAIDHELDVTSCGTRVRIVDQDNNTNLGTVTLTGDLSFRYEADAAAYGEDNITFRLRDDNGLETSVCIRTFVCGSGVPISGLPSGRTLGCGEVIPVGSPNVSSVECPVILPIPFTDQRIEGSCPGEYQIIRTWAKRNTCGTLIEASRSFFYVDDVDPVVADVPADVTICGNEPLPLSGPTATDGCGGSATLSGPVDVRSDVLNSSAYEIARTWTATDLCGNSTEATQVITVTEVPTLRGTPTATATNCGADDGTITIDFEDDARRTGIAFALNGAWQPTIGDDVRSVTYDNLPAGTYALRGQWGGGQRCPVDLGTVTIDAGRVPGANGVTADQKRLRALRSGSLRGLGCRGGRQLSVGVPPG